MFKLNCTVSVNDDSLTKETFQGILNGISNIISPYNNMKNVNGVVKIDAQIKGKTEEISMVIGSLENGTVRVIGTSKPAL